jgi:hypothetical protein
MRRGDFVRHVTIVATVMCAMWASAAFAQGMPNPKDMSGAVLAVTDIPVGTVSARVLRGGFDKVIPGQAVEFIVDGKSRTTKTDVDGRATITGLARGAKVKAIAVVDGERLESQDAVVGDSGLRILLVASDPEAEARAAANKSAPAVKGTVILGPETRIVAEMQNDQLTVFYILQIVNAAATPVDLGGPLVFELPRGARGTTVMEGSSPQATASGPRVTITGPLAPGVTSVQAAYELPYSGGTALLEQKMPAAWPQVTVIVQQLGGMTLSSSQLAARQEMNDQGHPLIVGTGPGLTAGQSLSLEIAGLPHRPAWPRNLALAMAGFLIAAGLWGALTAPRRHAVA